MSGHTQLWLLVVVAWLCVFNTAAYASYPSITLPDWRSNAGYLTRCDFDDDTTPFCDWTAEGLTRSQTRPGKFYLARDPGSLSGMARLQSRFLNSSEDLCLQFWYYKPHQDSSELRVSLSDEVPQAEIWSSLASESHAWRQVLIPLSYSHLNGAQIVFRLMQGHGNKEEIVFDKIGILRGQCGMQCQSGTQLWTDESTQCTCTEGQLTCTQIICGDGQTCRQAVTSTVSSGTCRVASDLRYRTFDGVNFRFMGPCAYILTKVCDGVSVVPGFAVEVQKEQRRNSSLSMIQQVKVNLQGLRVTLLRRDRRRIMVNGIWKNLPLSLYGDTVKVSAQGPVVELQTHFNLSVSYAKSGALHVTVPNQFSDKLCGMCGNFNHVMDDDHKMVNGSLAENAQVLGQSWKSEDPPCEEPTKPSMCSEAEKLEYASEPYCGILLSPHGPFSECPSALGAVSFFRSCVFEMCSTQGDPETFCDVLQAFAKTCNDAGIPVTGWRNATYCPLACGAHSHFNACSSECAATCSMLDAPENCGTCEERCECDDGFLRSGEKCVPADDCGCWVDGQHYGKGETFMQGDCKKQCLCAGQGTVQCSDASCVAHEVCKVKDEVLGCFPSSPVTCSIYGDPHYITFDGKAYSFRGTCNYTIAKTCTATAASFTLTARNEGRSNSSSLNSVALDVEELHLVIRKNRLVYVNGSQVTLPYSHSTSIKVLQKGPYVQVDTNFGLRFLFNGNDRLFVQLDERHMGTTCGLCGTYSGSQFDDFLTPDGNVVPYPHDFASSWNTHDKDWTCSNGSAEDPECPPELDSEGFRECSKLLGEAFKACHWFVPPQIFVNSCVSDHCTSGGDLSQLCTSLQNYVAACEVAEVFLADWWKDTVCAVIPTRPPTTAPASPTPTDPATPKTTQPTTSAPSAASCPWSCNFDQNECGWEQLIQDSFNWTRWSGPTPTDYTGPTSDHTTGSGYYMYIEADGVHYGDSARMMSPVCNTLGTQCLTFWYHIYGWATAMALNVYKLDGNQATKIWSRLNNQGNSWQLAQIEVDSQGPFQIIVEGIRGSDVGSDVAWDDITITYGKCGELSVSLNPETSSPTHGNQAFITPALFPSAPSLPGSSSSHPVCRIDCDFENNLCTWNQLLTDVFDWTRHSGSTPTPLTGPSFDHTTGSGHYIYIEGDSATHGDTARLLSEECTDQQPQCLQFWYHMYGSSWTMGLTVYLLHGNQAWEVWRKTEDQGNTWHRALVNLIPEGNFKVIFEGRRGDNAWSDVAVDDISLHRGTCEDVVQAEPVHTTAKLFRTTAVPYHNTAEPFQTTDEPFQTAVEPVHTTAEPVHITAEPFQTTDEPFQTAVEPVHTTAEPVHITAEPVQTTAEPVHITAKPFQTTAEPFQTAVEPVHTTAEPVHITAEPVQTTAEPVQTTAEPVHITAKPFQTTDEPFQTAVEPVHTTAEPVHITAEPVQTTAEPVHITAKPFQTTAEPFQTTVEPVHTTAEPVHITAESVQTTAEPVHITAKPFQTTAEPFQTTVEPVHTTAEPVHITAEPVQTTAEPVHITAKPFQTTAEPVHITAQPVQTTAEPVHITAEPVQTTAEPGHITAKPFQTTAEPFQTTAEPVHITAEPVQTTDEPVHITAEPLQTTAEPVQTTAEPVHTTAVPFQTTAEPVHTTAEPVQTTAEPVHTTAEPVHTTAELFRTRAEPVQTTAEPVHITAEPVHITAEPFQTTAEPFQTTIEPVHSTAEPVHSTAELFHTTTDPYHNCVTKPVQISTEPVHTTAQPLQTTAEPLQTTAKPLQTTAEPLQTTAEPLQTTAEPLQTTAEPLQATAESLQTTVEPFQITAEPVHTTAEPVHTTAKPVHAITEPVHTTTEPVHTTTESFQTTTEPVHTTTESFQTTTEPVHTTTEWDHNCVTKPVHTTSETVHITTDPDPNCVTKPLHITTEPVQTTVEHIQTTGSLDTVPSSISTTARPVETTAPNTTTTTTTTTPQPTPSCPINSHYANCLPTCQPTCEQLHGPPNCNTADSCAQGCVCNDGFVLRQRVCVPIWECGCQDDNGDNHYFGETWYSPHCTQKCECKRKGSQGELKCKDKECDSNEVCLMSEQGEYSCKSADFSTCSIDDDPEYRTFDNFKHKFKGKYSYVLVQTSNLPNNVPEVYIEGINQKSREQENRDEDYDDEDLDGRERGDDGDRSEVDDDSSEEDDDDGRLRALRMRVYNHTVEFREGRRVMVNGVLARAPVFPTPGLKILERSSRLYLQTDFGLSVEFKGKGKAEISLPDTYKTKVGGLCGNYDGRKNNDMMKPNGQQAHNVNEFGESWRVVAEKAAVRQRRFSLLYALLGLRQ